jgi:hypothetical protein
MPAGDSDEVLMALALHRSAEMPVDVR